jgi:hypothetical protein
MKPVEEYEGCGSFNDTIKVHIEKEIDILNSSIAKLFDEHKTNAKSLTKIWLTACLAKTLKEQVNSTKEINVLNKFAK